MVNQVVDKFQKIDILVNNAGTNIRKRPEEYSLKEWTSIINTNLVKYVYMFKSLLRAFY